MEFSPITVCFSERDHYVISFEFSNAAFINFW
jgi:hypothetical protein